MNDTNLNYEIQKVEFPDSVEVGTPKGGKLKLYFNADNEEQAKNRLEVAKKILAEATKDHE